MLGFSVSPESLAQGAEASWVVGQADFVTGVRNDGGITAAGLAFPNGVAYDSERRVLYVADQGHDRVLAFDVGAGSRRAGAEAFAVFGQKDFRTKSSQELRDVSAQDQLYDPRGIEFDSEHERLYVTDSHWARLLVFDAPVERRDIELPAHGAMKLSSLDAVSALSPSRRSHGFGIGRGDRGASWMVMRLTTEPLWNELTEQESRMLISQTASRAASAARHHVVWLDDRDSAKTEIWIVNPGVTDARITLSSYRGGELTRLSRNVAAGDVERVTETGSGTAVVDSDEPVAVTAFRLAPNRYGEETTTAIPATFGVTSVVVPNVTLGGGHVSDIVLLNPGSVDAEGHIALLDETGAEVERTSYSVAPDQHWLWELDGDRPVTRSYYARLTPRPGAVSAASLVRRMDEGLITATSYAPTPLVKQARVHVDTRRDLIRHGRASELRLVVSNPGDAGASVRFILRNRDGEEVDRMEQLFLPHSQSELTLGQLFDRARYSGTIALVSDVPIAVSARQVTTNLRGDEILTELPVAYETTDVSPVLLYVDGQGQATQWLASGARSREAMALEIVDESGEPMKVILR